MSFDGMIFNVAIVVVVIIGLGVIYSLSSSQSWQEVQATITKLEVKKDFSSQGTSNTTAVKYPVDVEYQFTVNGQSFTGTKIYAGLPNVFNSARDVEQFVSEYQGKQSVSVFYNRENPAQSAMRKPNTSTFALMVVFLFVIAVGVGIFYAVKKFNLLD